MKRLQILLYIVALTACCSLSAIALSAPFPPIDEGADEPDFALFREQLIQIVDTQDIQALDPLIHPDAQMSFGGNTGRNIVLKTIKQTPGYWSILANILRKGGEFRIESGSNGSEERAFYAPYTFFAEIPGSDNFAVVVLTDPAVPVYDEPVTTSKVIQRFRNEALAVVFGDKADNQTWFEIELPKGGTGFVQANQVTLSTDYRAGFVKHNGKWKMKFLGAGD